MDAPTTKSADDGTSGDNSGGGGGWFTPRKQPARPAGEEPEAAEGRRISAIRPVGRPGSGPVPTSEPSPAPTPSHRPTPTPETATPTSATPTPTSAATPSFGRAAETATTETAVTSKSSPGTDARTAPARAGTLLTQPEAAADPAAPLPRHPEPPAPEATAPGPAYGHEPLQAPAPDRAPASHPASDGASPDAVLVRRTMAEVGPVADKVTSYFYALLFVRHPDLRPLFPAAMDTQRDRLLKALLTAAEHIDNTDVLVAYLQNLGRGHRKYGTRPEHYPAVGECLIAALTRYATNTWDDETEAAWVRTYTTISQVMIDAAAEDELRAPAWWYAEVVSHDLRTSDIAVITVRPDQPYPFLAGQYASLETPWWPRIWRHYSFASAPRSDGLLSFHVKAVPAGWVSNALVHRARPGDVIRLGPPAGSMTVDHGSDSGLLCLGGGTGIAPIKALIEDVAEHGERRPVEVFYGARTDHDLYDIDTMLRLQQSHPWLEVRPVVDQQAHLQLPDAIRAYGPWNEYDAYLSGPPGMIRRGVDALRDIGIPWDRIRHDAVEELVAVGD
ncbi:flavohemoprotein [Streptomyces sp. PSKA54]|uniref:nitric oxide dioxygenase n=1 Tax=Streptomyces himalayensis subsp. aureolus TaxID=2758039 RepID=A0A7W2D1C8_9ACTN|nr:globin domain-containing protein [Streptomyces himalayensis]MBA4862954.1 flavohemoprotein [Streptomyces himalayensis subsp. aureolus]